MNGQEGRGASLGFIDLKLVSSNDSSFAMDSTSYILLKGNKRLTLREEDMMGDKIARIFQVSNTFFVRLENMIRSKDASTE